MISLRSLSLVLLVGTVSAACRKQCVVPASGGTSSDSAAIQEVLDRCNRDSLILFEEGSNYNVFEPIAALNLTNVILSVQGNLHLPQDISAVQKIVAGGNGHWFDFAGTDIQYIGNSDISHGWIYSYGQAWWSANAKAGGTGLPNRPHLMAFKATNGVMNYFKSSKPVAWNLAVKGSNIKIANAVVDSVSEDWSFPFNTDGVGIGATDVHVTDCVIYNGDDAFAISDGAKNVVVERSIIGYQTHGMSIGSLGSDAKKFYTVSNIRFDDITVAGGLYAARFKSWVGGQGLVKDVSWSNIRLHNVTFPIFITQTYSDQGKASANRPNNSSVQMRNFKWDSWAGSINSYNPGDGSCASNPCWYNVGLPNLKHNEAIIVECNEDDSCQGFEFDNMRIYPQDMTAPSVICMKATAALNPNLGIDCRNGTYVPL
ncbi:hypothetical protein VDGE_09366 [Verticillium dahliae]|uniref:galacturonan 1,4-alpha-galacturonidase n=1 Tax=Verticillium dahliae TaxID=27337 RepID=A0A444RJX2_VERDA|nr:hypothetical protein VDGE_09366 [Verticillium dahliae]